MEHLLFTVVRAGMRPAPSSIFRITQVRGTAALGLRVPASALGKAAIFCSTAIRPPLMGRLSSRGPLPSHFLEAVLRSTLIAQRRQAMVHFLSTAAAFLVRSAGFYISSAVLRAMPC